MQLVDANDEVHTQVITIERVGSIPESKSYRWTTCVLQFQDAAEDADFCRSCEQILTGEIENGNRFRQVKRGEFLKAMEEEYRISESDLVNKKFRLAKRVVPAETFFIGSVSTVSGVLKIHLELVSVETSELIMLAKAYCDIDEKSHSTAEYKMKELHEKIIKNIPVVEGTVTKSDRDEITTDITSDENIRTSMKFIFFRKTDNPYEPEKIGEGLVKEVDAKKSVSKKTSVTEGKDVLKGDIAYTK